MRSYILNGRRFSTNYFPAEEYEYIDPSGLKVVLSEARLLALGATLVDDEPKE